jgi:hypothetical protein
MKPAIASRSPMTQRTAFFLVSLMAMGCFGIFSGLELNGFLNKKSDALPHLPAARWGSRSGRVLVVIALILDVLFENGQWSTARRDDTKPTFPENRLPIIGLELFSIAFSNFTTGYSLDGVAQPGH